MVLSRALKLCNFLDWKDIKVIIHLSIASVVTTSFVHDLIAASIKASMAWRIMRSDAIIEIQTKFQCKWLQLKVSVAHRIHLAQPSDLPAGM